MNEKNIERLPTAKEDFTHPKAEREEIIEFSRSKYRIDKLKSKIHNLGERLLSYLEKVEQIGKPVHTAKEAEQRREEREKIETETTSLFYRIDNLLNRMDDYGLSEEETNSVLDIIEAVENLKKEYYGIQPFLRTDERHEWRKRVEQFNKSYQQKIAEIVSKIERLPTDHKSGIKFESGHEENLIQALTNNETESARDVILEIDKLISDDYAEYPKTIRGGATLRFRIEQALKKEFYRIDLTEFKTGKVQPFIILRKEKYGPNQGKFIVSLEGLTEEQEKIWKQIQ